MPAVEPARARVLYAARAIVLAGAVLLSYGAGLVYRPAGFIVAGGLLLVAGLGALRG